MSPICKFISSLENSWLILLLWVFFLPINKYIYNIKINICVYIYLNLKAFLKMHAYKNFKFSLFAVTSIIHSGIFVLKIEKRQNKRMNIMWYAWHFKKWWFQSNMYPWCVCHILESSLKCTWSVIAFWYYLIYVYNVLHVFIWVLERFLLFGEGIRRELGLEKIQWASSKTFETPSIDNTLKGNRRGKSKWIF